MAFFSNNFEELNLKIDVLSSKTKLLEQSILDVSNRLERTISTYSNGVHTGLIGKWISIKDGMPKDGVIVLVLVDRLWGVSKVIAYRCCLGKWFSNDTRDKDCLKVAYWMPIPAIPKESQG